MGSSTHQPSVWALARAQKGVITHEQLEALGYSGQAIHHRIKHGRLHRVYRGVYAVGRAELTQEGRWMAAVLACGDTAALSHDSAAALWKLTKAPTTPIHVSVLSQSRSRKGIAVHRRRELKIVRRNGIRVTTPEQTLIDLAPHPQLEQAIGEATLHRLTSLRALRTAATEAGKSGASLRHVIERTTFRVTQSELERQFLRLVTKAGLALRRRRNASARR